MVDQIRIFKAKQKDAIKLQSLRLQLVKENPKIYGVVYQTEKNRGLDYYKKWLKEYSRPDAGIFLLELNGEIIGMGAVKPEHRDNPTVGYFGSLGVLRKCQGKGYGKMMLEHRLNWARENTKFKTIKTIIVKTNKPALILTQRLGFKITGEGSYYGVEEYHLEKDMVQPISHS